MDICTSVICLTFCIYYDDEGKIWATESQQRCANRFSCRWSHLLMACGGWNDKGTLHGLGREGLAIFNRPAKSTRSGCSTSSTYTSPLVTQLQDQLQTTNNELQTIQAQLYSTEEELRSTREELEATRKQLDEQRIGLMELNARFESFSSLLGHPTRVDNSQASSQV